MSVRALQKTRAVTPQTIPEINSRRATGGRTPVLLNAIQALSQLSYSPSKKDHTRFYLVIMVAVPNMENIIICRPYVTVNLLLLKILNISVQSPADVSSF